MSAYPLDRLQKTACHLQCWNEYYQRVLSFLAEMEQKQAKSKPPNFYYHDNFRQRRVEVLFTHADKEAAWELSLGAVLSEEWWLKLADWRSQAVPEDAASILRKLVAKALVPTGEYAYAEVVKYLKLYGKYMGLAGKDAEFVAYCSTIRVEYKRRRLLLAQMDKAKL